MNILLVTSEAVPFAKTGGLADVCGALPIELARQGHCPILMLPAYRSARYCGLPLEPLDLEFIVPIGSKMVSGRLIRSKLPGVEVPVYLVAQDHYYDRDQLYGVDGKDYPDNCERFVFFCRAVLEAIRLLGLDIDVIHANDWQTGLVPAYLRIEYRHVPRYQQIASVFTIHNLAYQGQFWHWDMLLTGLDWKYFNWHQMEFHGKLNLLKTGLVFADAITTVSPRYAQEIQTSPLGCGLEGVLQQRRDVLYGILNGMDVHEWNPASDPHLPVRYTPETVWEAKPACKAALQSELGLPADPRAPLIGFVGRLTDQKGLDILVEVLQTWLQAHDAQWVILGTGQPKYHRLLETLAERFPQKLAVRLEFSTPLAHRVEGGADLFVMPSKFEPCGLSQLYSLKYGTVPVVRSTGGLADTITDPDQATEERPANGFAFEEYSAPALSEALRRACDAYRENGDLWHRIVATGMAQDWSWARSARQYAQLYEETCRRVRAESPNGV